MNIHKVYTVSIIDKSSFLTSVIGTEGDKKVVVSINIRTTLNSGLMGTYE